MQKRKLGKSNLEVLLHISGTTKLHRLEENIGGVAVELSTDDLQEIESAASKITMEGARYPAHIEKMTGLWTTGRLRFPLVRPTQGVI